MRKQLSAFSTPRRAQPKDSGAGAATIGEDGAEGGEPMPDFEDPRVQRTMSEIESEMEHLDENNPRHMARMLRKMKDLLPTSAAPRELEVAIRRLEAGEDPDKIEADMGDVLGDFMGEPGDGDEGGGGGRGGGYSRDAGLYDY